MKNTFVLDIINKCNLFYPYCFWPENNTEFLTFEEVQKILKDKKENYIVLTWWEPLLHKDINSIIKLVFDLWKKVILHTNWVLLTKDFLALNKNYIYRINLPIDSLNPEINWKLRWKLHLERFKKAINLVKEFWIKFSITSVFTSINEDYFLKLADYLIEFNPDLWRIFEFKVVWKSNDINLIPNKNKIKSFQNDIKKYNLKRLEFIMSDSFYK